MAAPESVVILSDDDDFCSNPAQTSAQPVKRNIAVKRTAPQPQPALPQPHPQSQKLKKDMECINNSTFLSDFNPLNSRREKNKQFRNLYVQKTRQQSKKQTGTLYDEQGRLKSTGADVCDCFDAACEGCHFPCEWCQSEKCSIKCRNNRRFMYEVIEYDGKDKVTHNPNLLKQL